MELLEGIVGAFRTIASIITLGLIVPWTCSSSKAQMLERRKDVRMGQDGRRFADEGRLSKGRIRDICPFWNGAKLKPTGRPSSTTRPSILLCPWYYLRVLCPRWLTRDHLFLAHGFKADLSLIKIDATFLGRSIGQGILANTFCFKRILRGQNE